MVKFLQDTVVDPVDTEVTQKTHICIFPNQHHLLGAASVYLESWTDGVGAVMSACLSKDVSWFFSQWFGFLKTGQAKETETLQESVLYKEVTVFVVRIVDQSAFIMHHCQKVRKKSKASSYIYSESESVSPFRIVWVWQRWTKPTSWFSWRLRETTSSSPESGSTQTCCLILNKNQLTSSTM